MKFIPTGTPMAERSVENEPELVHMQHDEVAALWPFIGLTILRELWYQNDITERVARHNLVTIYLLGHHSDRRAYRAGAIGYNETLARARRWAKSKEQS